MKDNQAAAKNQRKHTPIVPILIILAGCAILAVAFIVMRLMQSAESDTKIDAVFSEKADEEFLSECMGKASEYWLDKYGEQLSSDKLEAIQLSGAGKYGWNSIAVQTGTQRDDGGDCYILLEFPDGFDTLSSGDLLIGDNRQSSAILADATSYLEEKIEACKNGRTIEIVMNTSENSGSVAGADSAWLLPLNFSVCFRETMELEDTDGDACCFFTTSYDGVSISDFLEEEKDKANLSFDVKRVDIYAADESNEVMEGWENVYDSVCNLMESTFDEYAGIAVFGKLNEEYKYNRTSESYDHSKTYDILKSNQGVDRFAEAIDNYTYRY